MVELKKLKKHEDSLNDSVEYSKEQTTVSKKKPNPILKNTVSKIPVDKSKEFNEKEENIKVAYKIKTDLKKLKPIFEEQQLDLLDFTNKEKESIITNKKKQLKTTATITSNIKLKKNTTTTSFDSIVFSNDSKIPILNKDNLEGSSKNDFTNEGTLEATNSQNMIVLNDSQKQSTNNFKNNIIENNLLYEIEKKKLEIISEELNTKNLSNNIKVIENVNLNVEDMLDTLESQTKNVDEDVSYIEMFSFLDSEPKKTKIKYIPSNVSNLYAKLDEIENKEKTRQKVFLNTKKKKKQKKIKKKKIEIYPLIEKIEIPDIITIEDDTKIIEAINEKHIILEKESEKEKPKEPNFINSNDKLEPNPLIDEKIKKIKENKKKEKQKEEEKKELAKTSEIKINADEIKMPINELNISIPKKENINLKEMDSYNYLLPKDYLNNETENIVLKNKNEINLIYTSQIKQKTIDFDEINEKYNIDEFSFVNINQKDNELFYNIVQPELTKTQEKIYLDLKKIFFDAIDVNYFSFRGDKKETETYIKKIFDLTLDKTSYDLSNLEKKLYFSFILQDFSGLGFLTSVLDDKNILEINCMGADIPIYVYHIKYGLIKSNLIFNKISELNLFVLSLAKITGVRLNVNNPIINTNLPNGYKVEGLYSLGDTSNKGSSFVIKKYLEQPLTPVNLINLGIGSPDIFSYIWSIIDLNYQIIITGEDNVLFFNSIAQFYPNKNIISVQSYDYFKLPQKNWIKRKVDVTSNISKVKIIDQTFLERPDYVFLDVFEKDFYDSKWYNLNLTTVNLNLINEHIHKIKTIGLDAIVIYLDRIKINNLEQMQISKIIEIKKGKENTIIEFKKDDGVYHVNLVPSNLNVVDYFKKQKVLRWSIDADIVDYLDFNNIVNDYYLDKRKLFKKLNISEKD